MIYRQQVPFKPPPPPLRFFIPSFNPLEGYQNKTTNAPIRANVGDDLGAYFGGFFFFPEPVLSSDGCALHTGCDSLVAPVLLHTLREREKKKSLLTLSNRTNDVNDQIYSALWRIIRQQYRSCRLMIASVPVKTAHVTGEGDPSVFHRSRRCFSVISAPPVSPPPPSFPHWSSFCGAGEVNWNQ